MIILVKCKHDNSINTTTTHDDNNNDSTTHIFIIHKLIIHILLL